MARIDRQFRNIVVRKNTISVHPLCGIIPSVFSQMFVERILQTEQLSFCVFVSFTLASKGLLFHRNSCSNGDQCGIHISVRWSLFCLKLVSLVSLSDIDLCKYGYFGSSPIRGLT